MNRYAVIDLETSGGNPLADRITEICVHLFDGEKIVDTFHSLIHPEVSIPYHITRITGITNQMVEDAPKFYEVAKRVVEITEGAIFVAHNVRFDYGFIQKEFRNLGYTYSRPQLCTVQLARKLVEDIPSHSLGNLCTYFGIKNEQAHRAYSDASATVELLKCLFERMDKSSTKWLKEQIADVKMPPHLAREIYDNLPDEAGVYYWHNAFGEVIYVGKSTEIKTRIRSHFREAHKRKRSLQMLEEVHDISYELTGGELGALLLENEEIKKIQPKYNRAQKRSAFHYGIFSEPNADNYLSLKVETLKTQSAKPESLYATRRFAEAALQRRIEAFKLCPKFCGMEKSNGACFSYQLKRCEGACAGVESPEIYNERVVQAIESFGYEKPHFLVITSGRSYEECLVVRVENGRYQGWAYLHRDFLQGNLQTLIEAIPYKNETPDVLNILRQYIRKHPKTVRTYTLAPA